MYLTSREVVSVFGIKRRAVALMQPSKLNMTVTEFRLRRKIEFDERVELPQELRDKVLSAAVNSVIENCDEIKGHAKAAFKIVIEDLIVDRNRIYGCDISTHRRVGVWRRDIIFPGHYVHFLAPIDVDRSL